MSELEDPSVLALAERLGVSVAGVDRRLALLDVVNAVGKTGMVVVVKCDGERSSKSGENGTYTAILSNPAEGSGFFRRDDDGFVEALEHVFRGYYQSLSGAE